MDIIGKTYANAMFTLALENNNLKDIDDQLRDINKIINDNLELKNIINSMTLNKEERLNIINELFEKIIDRDLLNFLKLLSDKGRFSFLNKVTYYFHKLYLNHYMIKEAFVYSAKIIALDKIANLKLVLERKYTCNIEIENIIDENLIAGLKIVIGDEVIDGSVLAKLKNIEKAMIK